jgi:hypothetical protein
MGDGFLERSGREYMCVGGGRTATGGQKNFYGARVFQLGDRMPEERLIKPSLRLATPLTIRGPA